MNILCFNGIHIWAVNIGYVPVLTREETFPYPQPLIAKKPGRWLARHFGGMGKPSEQTRIPTGGIGVLQYPLQPLRFEAPTPGATPPNILFLFIDTWRFDALTPEIMPRLSKRADNALVFRNHLSGGNGTRPGVFSAFYAIPGTYWSTFLAMKRRPVFMETLAQRHYEFGIYASAYLTWPEFHQTVFEGIPNLRLSTPDVDPADADGRDRASEQEFLQFLEQRDKNRPFFGFLFYDTLHKAYAVAPDPQAPMPFQPSASAMNYLQLTNGSDPLPIHNLYKNWTYNLDIALDHLFEKLEKQGVLKNTILILTGDHGQEFNETHTNTWGHCTDYTSYQLHVPFLIFWPGKPPATYNHVTTHNDIVPTLMQELFGCQNRMDDYTSGKSLFDPASRDGFIITATWWSQRETDIRKDFAIYHDGGVQLFKKHGIGENKTLDYTKDAPPLPAAVLQQALKDMKRFQK